MFGALWKKFRKSNGWVCVVSGLPRSGTSMMMKMLEAGGLPVLTDGLREADSDNPNGYLEFERVKKLDQGDSDWINQARGKAVKVISALLKHLPSGHQYKVIFMKRLLDEVLASQSRMLENRGEMKDPIEDERMAGVLARHLEETEAWLNQQVNFDVLEVDYNKMLSDPGAEIAYVNQFLGGKLETSSMQRIVDPKLYRQRSAAGSNSPGRSTSPNATPQGRS